MQREKLASRLGFILLSAGCAIGIGNVWKFPYMVGKFGGGAFVLLYFIFLLIFGVPIMCMEFSIGRAAQKSPVKIFQELEKPGQKWHIHGYISMLGNYLLMMFYTCVTGWMLYYLYASISGTYVGMSSDEIGGLFSSLLASPLVMTVCMVIVVVSGFLILSRGLQNGLEKVTKVMMILLIVLMVVLAINSMFLKGGQAGLEFYLKPDFNRMQEAGVKNAIVGAMSQSFFTLSLGMGSLAIFGSYIGKEKALMGESINVAFLDTFVAVCSGLIIFPACFAYNISVDSGPGLLFVTLPNLFNNLPFGRIWGSIFFLFMLFAAYSTVLAVFENIVSCCMDLFGWSRKKACFINMGLIIVLSIPCVLGFNVLSNITIFNLDILGVEDFIVSNLILPLGSMVFLFFCILDKGWGWDNFIKEVNTGEGLKFPGWAKKYILFVLPLVLATVFIIGLI